MSEIKQIATALLKAQSEMSNPKKGSTNPFFKSKYADLNSIREAVIPVLNANGISVLQPTYTVDNKNFVKTILLHESGEFLESYTEILFAKQNDAQAQGSGISYARRYALQSFVCIGADDDDAQKANAQPTAPAATKKELKHLDKEHNFTAEWSNLQKAILEKRIDSIETVKKHYTLTPEIEVKVNELLINSKKPY
jgi:ERF superfamily